MKKKYLILLVVFLLITGCSSKEVPIDNCYEDTKLIVYHDTAFDVRIYMPTDYVRESILLRESENIIIGKVIRSGQKDVTRIEDSSTQGISNVEVIEVLKGEMKDKTIDVTESYFGLSGTTNDTFIELEEGKQYILFIDMYQKIPDDPIYSKDVYTINGGMRGMVELIPCVNDENKYGYRLNYLQQKEKFLDEEETIFSPSRIKKYIEKEK